MSETRETRNPVELTRPECLVDNGWRVPFDNEAAKVAVVVVGMTMLTIGVAFFFLFLTGGL